MTNDSYNLYPILEPVLYDLLMNKAIKQNQIALQILNQQAPYLKEAQIIATEIRCQWDRHGSSVWFILRTGLKSFEQSIQHPHRACELDEPPLQRSNPLLNSENNQM